MPRAEGLATMAHAMEDVQNYSDWVSDALRPHLGRSVLEIGPGYGGIARRILAAGIGYRAIDSDASVVAALRARLPVPPEHLSVGDVTAPEWAERFRAAGVDTVLTLNVLEHIEDDAGFIRAAALCAPKGRLVLLVPAMPCLYGSFDSQAGHLRRYSAGGLRRVLAAAGLTVRHLSYFNAVGAAAWLLSAKVLRLAIDSGRTDRSIRLYDRWAIPVARRLDPVLRAFAGQSLIAVADLP